MRLLPPAAVAVAMLVIPSAASAAPRLEPEPCDLPRLAVQADCFRLAVPENRAARGSRTITLSAIVLRSRAAIPAAEPLVYLQGGPGEAANVEAESLSRSPLLDRQDVVLLDQRGTGRSRPELQCPEYAAVAPRFFAPGVGYREARALARRALAACARRLRGAGVDLAGYRSKETARDVEDLRLALGARRVDLYGVSYGTRAALTTLREHPFSIRAVVADSGAGPEGADTRPRVLGANLRDGFARFFRGRPALRRQYSALRAELDRRPLRARARLGGARRASPVELTGEDAAVLVHQLLRDAESAAQVPAVIAGLRARDAATVRHTFVALLEAATEPGSTILGAQLSVDCGDAGPLTAADRRLLAAPGELATFFLFASGGFCDVWGVPAAPAVERRPVVADAPVLLVAGSLDPISPPAALEAAGEGLRWRAFLELAGEGHVPTRQRPCLEAEVARWLASPESPPRPCRG